TPATEALLCKMHWPGNVRQLENTCRWLTVMASGREIHPADLPPELTGDSSAAPSGPGNWQQGLRNWAASELERGNSNLLAAALPELERVLITSTLDHTNGRRREASLLLGWGRNTLTRKIKELGLQL
ncbi:MAG: two-component system nitrogen regulation response regulator GlnG, partial [Halieaceae bacterium]